MQTALTDPKRKRVRLFWAAVLCIAAALLLELLLSNFHSLFIYSNGYEELDLAPYCTDEIIDGSGNYILMPSSTGVASIEFENAPGGLFSLSFDIRYADRTTEDALPAPTVAVTAHDPRTSWQSNGNITLSTEQFAVGEGGAFRTVTVYASVESDTAGDLTLAFSGLDGIVEIQSIRLNVPPSFGFSPVRFLLLALLCFIPCALSLTGLLYTLYDPKDLMHRHGVKTAVLFSVILAILFSSLFLYNNSSIAYPLEGAVRSYQPYIQQFDAFIKGQLHLDVPVSDEMLSLENPYDYDTRADADPLWDRAYYDGKYYSYFGITPIILVYFPYYLLSGELPSDSFVMTVFLLIAAVFIPLCVLKWADLHEQKRVPLPVVWLGAVTAFIGSMMLLIARSVTPFYYIATIAASAFLSVFLYLLLKGAEAEGLRDRVFFFVLAGLAYTALLHARLNIALLAVFIVIPYLIFRVLKKREYADEAEPPIDTDGGGDIRGIRARLSHLLLRIRAFFAPPKEIVISLLSLGIPVLLGLGIMLGLNAARFGSPFEFGTSYQLTVSDVRYNTVSVANLFPAIYHYFFQRMQTSAFFPFFALNRETVADYGHYVYTDASFGLFSLPLMTALFLSPAFCLLRSRTRYEKVLLVCLLIGLVTVALLNFSLGGVIFRYVADLTVLAALGAVALIFALCSAASDGADAITDTSAKALPRLRAVTVSALLFFLISCTVPLLLSLSYNGNLTKYASETFIALKNFFSFG